MHQMTTTESSSASSRDHVLDHYVASVNGTTPISKILIANHGMAAVKAIRSIRKWCYEEFGSEHTIELLVMCTPEDIASNAEYLLLADRSIPIQGGPGHQTYANIPLICSIAEEHQVHAVWVGWGYASENPDLPRALSRLSRQIAFIGPPAHAMQSLGDKIASNIIAQSLSIPCLPWSGQQVKLSSNIDFEHSSQLLNSLLEQASIHDLESGSLEARRIGFPLMLKASQGGGGRGIRLVHSIHHFPNAFQQVRQEVPESPIFIMKVLENARHLEVQVIADLYGNAMTLFGRDCTVQRRHQKIIEEAPVTVAPHSVLKEMESAALRLVKFVGYQGLGTVEFLYDPSTSEYYFLELNPRLQVEHPTTEMVSGLNLPAIQVQIAMGIPLHRIREIRLLYGLQPHEKGQIDFTFLSESSKSTQRQPRPKGHVVAARITAENPENGFRPNAGKMLDLNFRSSPNVWGYFSINALGGVLETADSQIGHVFAYGSNRDEARKSLVMALKELSIRSEFATTVPFLIELLEKKQFVDNMITTSWLDKIILLQQVQASNSTFDDMEATSPSTASSLTTAVCAAISIAHKLRTSNTASFIFSLERGHSPNLDLLRVDFSTEFILKKVHYRFKVLMQGPDRFVVQLANEPKSGISVRISTLPEHGLLLHIGTRSHVVYVNEEDIKDSAAEQIRLTLDGRLHHLSRQMDPSKLSSPSPGRLLRFLVKDGSLIHKGDVYAEMEVMKMTMPLVSSRSGIIHYKLQPGSSLKVGDVIGTLIFEKNSAQLEDDTVPFQGSLHSFLPTTDTLQESHITNQIDLLVRDCQLIFQGYHYEGSISHLVQRLLEYFKENNSSNQESKSMIQIMSDLFDSFLAPFLIFQQYHASDFSEVLKERYREITATGSSNTDVLLWAQSVRHTSTFSLELVASLLDTLKIVSTNMNESERKALDDIITKFSLVQKWCPKPYQVAKELQSWLAERGDMTDPNELKNMLESIAEDLNRVDKSSRCEVDIQKWKNRISGRADLLRQLSTILLGGGSILQYPAALASLLYLNQIHEKFNFHCKDIDSDVKCYWSTPGEDAVTSVTSLIPIYVVLMFGPSSKGLLTSNLDWIASGEHPVHVFIYSPLLEPISSLPDFWSTSTAIVSVSNIRSRSIATTYVRSAPCVANIPYSLLNGILPADCACLELERFSRYQLRRLTHVERISIKAFMATAIENVSDQRIFLRSVILPLSIQSTTICTPDALFAHGSGIMTNMLDAISLVQQENQNTDSNHIFICFMPPVDLDVQGSVKALQMILARHGKRFLEAHVSTAEVVLYLKLNGDGELQKTRFIVTTDSGFVVQTQIFKEEGSMLVLLSDTGLRLSSSTVHSLEPYPIKTSLQSKRHRAHLLGTTYVYDIPNLFEEASREVWVNQGEAVSAFTFESHELILDSHEKLQLVDRPIGQNSCGMVAWKIRFSERTGFSESICEIVVLANDITFQIGSFGPDEQTMFRLVSEYAREHKFPRIYISASSGARIGLADEIKDKFKIAWKDEMHPESGLDYLYLDEQSYADVCGTNEDQVVEVERIDVNDGTVRFKLVSVIGKEHGFGVENLTGSGAIAGETSRAYQDIFTITMVSCRSVGIGAYLARLGHRVIQIKDSSIILTGAAALNKLLGKEVYRSNLQIGGPKIMYHNGTSHRVAKNDMDGVRDIIRWLSYVPLESSYVPNIDSTTSLGSVQVLLETGKTDPRVLFTGMSNVDGDSFLQGFFDRNSFMEVMSGWAQSVIVGRARLGGLPIGVIGVETRITEDIVWADPANPASLETRTSVPGQVWNPQSAFKTAQAIRDMNNGEHLPLIIFANWRGFSGGQTDMYNQVLTFGSMIVDALVEYKQPVFVYIVGELRGGAWVVLDSSINKRYMEMYAAESARGNILEPEGVVSIKFREKQKQELLARSLPNDLKSLEGLNGLAHQAAVCFAEMHDTTKRMVSKRVIHGVIPWEKSREFFYWRLRWKYIENEADNVFTKLHQGLPYKTEDEPREHWKDWLSTEHHISCHSRSSTEDTKDTVLLYQQQNLKEKWVEYVEKLVLEKQISYVSNLLKLNPHIRNAVI